MRDRLAYQAKVAAARSQPVPLPATQPALAGSVAELRDQWRTLMSRHTDVQARDVEAERLCTAIGAKIAARATELFDVETATREATIRFQDARAHLYRVTKARGEVFDRLDTATADECEAADAEVEAATQERDAAQRALWAIRPKTVNAYLAALGEVRTMGAARIDAHHLNPDTERLAVSVARYFPADWVEHSNGAGEVTLKVTEGVRPHFFPASRRLPERYDTEQHPPGWKPAPTDNLYAGWWHSDTLPDGSTEWRGPERIIRSTKPDQSIGWYHESAEHTTDKVDVWWTEPPARWDHSGTMELSDATDVSTATHEFAHRMEQVVPHVSAMEAAFKRRRTRPANVWEAVTPEPMGAGYRDDEVTVPDGFADRYMGKVYPDSNHHEVLSTGMEALFHGHFGGLVGTDYYRPDHDMRNFVLGVLATC